MLTDAGVKEEKHEKECDGRQTHTQAVFLLFNLSMSLQQYLDTHFIPTCLIVC